MTDRRTFVKVAAATIAAPSLARCRPAPAPAGPAWQPEAFAKTDASAVAVLAADAYDGRLVDVIRRGLDLFAVDAAGKHVVLKPNFVEFDPAGAINTSPILIAAAIEAFRLRGAREVIVAEGPGHRRDTEYIVTASGLADVLRDTGARYVDLNMDAVRQVGKRSSFSGLDSLVLPRTVVDADLLVSMPKLKTHHWAGVTLSLKNMFGIMPGAIYGWPKNVLHWAGIEPSILDINAALRVPRFNIVDGIIGMEGNGPIQGSARKSGVVVFGADPVAVDATATRLMGIEPGRIWYLAQANRFLGNSGDDRIEQRGEDLVRYSAEFALAPGMDRLRPGRSAAG